MSEDKRRNLRDMLDEIDRYIEEFENEVQEAVRDTISMAKPSMKPFVAGFSLRVGPEGRPSMQVFGDSPLRSDGHRSPMSEQVLDAKSGMLRLIVEMPGVEKEDIKIDVTDDTTVVTAEKGQRKYRADVKLKAQVSSESAKAEYQNGVLEISFSLKDKANKGYRRVRIV